MALFMQKERKLGVELEVEALIPSPRELEFQIPRWLCKGPDFLELSGSLCDCSMGGRGL